MNKQTQEYKCLMEAENWSFHKLHDSDKHYWGNYGENAIYSTYINLNKPPTEIQFFIKDKLFRVIPPQPFSQLEFLKECCKCDCCGKVYAHYDELQLINIWDKACKTCCENNL